MAIMGKRASLAVIIWMLSILLLPGGFAWGQETTTPDPSASLLQEVKKIQQQHGADVREKRDHLLQGITDSFLRQEQFRILGPEAMTVPLAPETRAWLLSKGKEQLREEKPNWEILYYLTACFANQPPSDDIVELMRTVLEKPQACDSNGNRTGDPMRNTVPHIAFAVLAQQGTPEAMKILTSIALICKKTPRDLFPPEGRMSFSDETKEVYFRIVCGAVTENAPQQRVLPFFKKLVREYGPDFKWKQELASYLETAKRIDADDPHPLGPQVVSDSFPPRNVLSRQEAFTPKNGGTALQEGDLLPVLEYLKRKTADDNRFQKQLRLCCTASGICSLSDADTGLPERMQACESLLANPQTDADFRFCAGLQQLILLDQQMQYDRLVETGMKWLASNGTEPFAVKVRGLLAMKLSSAPEENLHIPWDRRSGLLADINAPAANIVEQCSPDNLWRLQSLSDEQRSIDGHVSYNISVEMQKSGTDPAKRACLRKEQAELELRSCKKYADDAKYRESLLHELSKNPEKVRQSGRTEEQMKTELNGAARNVESANASLAVAEQTLARVQSDFATPPKSDPAVDTPTK